MKARRKPARSGALVLAVLAIAALAIVLLLLRDRADAPKKISNSDEEAARAGGGRNFSGGGANARGGVAQNSSNPDDPHARPSVPPPKPAEKYPYPPGSQPLVEGSDPSAGVKEDNPVDAESGVHVVFGARRDVVHPPDPIVIDLEVLNAQGKRLAIANGKARFRSEKAGPRGPWFDVAFVDDGSGADRAREDLAYTATYSPTTTEQAVLSGFRVFVEVGFDAPNNLGPRRYVTSLAYTPKPGAELNGQYSDALVGGSLVVQCGLSVAHAGQFKVIASLYAGDHETAIAFAQNSQPLDAGERSVPLTFFGKILRERNIDGPYVLRYVMAFEEFPQQGIYHPGVTVDNAYTTAKYSARDFSDASYEPPPSAAAGEAVTAESPSQADKPPPLYGADQRQKLAGTQAPFVESTGSNSVNSPNGPSAPNSPNAPNAPNSPNAPNAPKP